MGHRQSPAIQLGEKASRRLLGVIKHIRQKFAGATRGADKTVLLILGCQRSGTTLVQQILQRDMRSKVYGEFSKLSSQDREHRIRLNPLDSVRDAINADRADLIVMKPLVESQNALKMLDAFENAKVLWMYRDFRDTAVSSINLFGPDVGLNELKSVIDNRKGDWRAEGLSSELRDIVAANYSPDMDPHDAAGLFWFVRNSWLFEQNLQTNGRVMICSYENLVAEPASTIKKVYDFIGLEFPGEKILPSIYQESAGQGDDLQMSEEIQRLCSDLLGRINSCQSNSTPPPS